MNLIRFPVTTRANLEKALSELPVRTTIYIQDEEEFDFAFGKSSVDDLKFIGGKGKQFKFSEGDNIQIDENDVIGTTPDIRVNTMKATAFEQPYKGIYVYDLSEDSRYVPLVKLGEDNIVAGQLILKTYYADSVHYSHYHITISTNELDTCSASIEGGSENNVKAVMVEADETTRGIYFLNSKDETPVKQEVIIIGTLTNYIKTLNSKVESSVTVLARA